MLLDLVVRNFAYKDCFTTFLVWMNSDNFMARADKSTSMRTSSGSKISYDKNFDAAIKTSSCGTCKCSFADYSG